MFFRNLVWFVLMWCVLVVPGRALEPAGVCAVCREGQEPIVVRIEHAGREYGFCSKACADKFRANPAIYEGKPAPTTGSAAPSCPL